jgi:rhodanese-related sulfurtransferase
MPAAPSRLEGAGWQPLAKCDRQSTEELNMAEAISNPFWQCCAGSWALLSLALLASIGFAATASAAGGEPDKPAPAAATPQLPKAKQTELGLYLTAKEAYEKWKAEPEKVKILDVRTPEEYLFVGHPPMAWKIPVAAQSYEWDAEKKKFPMTPLPDFVARVSQIAKTNDTLLVMCRSGGRSAIAVNMLAKAGFTKAYNITDGMEGDPVEDPASVFLGQRLVNGWKNSGCPWTYKLTPEHMVLPNRRT